MKRMRPRQQIEHNLPARKLKPRFGSNFISINFDMIFGVTANDMGQLSSGRYHILTVLQNFSKSVLSLTVYILLSFVVFI